MTADQLILSWRKLHKKWKKQGLETGDVYASGCAYAIKRAADELQRWLEEA